MVKKMPKKMRARHVRRKDGGDYNGALPIMNVRVRGKYNNENIKDSPLTLTDEELLKWKEEHGRK